MLQSHNIINYSFFSVLMINWFLITFFVTSCQAWDSEKWNPTHSTHSYITEWAIDNISKTDPELTKLQSEFNANRGVIINGANQELHELAISGTLHGIDLESMRLKHKGTNAGCDDIEGYWADSIKAYKENKKEQAYFLLGIMLHMIEDMGVPAHANNVYHQGNLREFDNFEYLAFSNWKPIFPGNSNDNSSVVNPNYSDPSKYYQFNQKWTHDDAPDYNNRNTFSKIWLLASIQERSLLQNRQGRTSRVVAWALESALKAFNS